MKASRTSGVNLRREKHESFLGDDLNSVCSRQNCECHRLELMSHFCKSQRDGEMTCRSSPLSSVAPTHKLNLPNLVSVCALLFLFFMSGSVSGSLFTLSPLPLSLKHFTLFSRHSSHPHPPSLSDPETHKPNGMEEKLRRPLFSASLSSPSPRSNPTRRRPIKHDSWVGHTLCLKASDYPIRVSTTI